MKLNVRADLRNLNDEYRCYQGIIQLSFDLLFIEYRGPKDFSFSPLSFLFICLL